MPKAHSALLAFNRGLMSRLGAARVDIARHALSAEVFTNWMARVLGSMMLRPGAEYLGSTKSNAKAKSLPFVFSSDDTAQLEVTENVLRVLIDDVLISRPAVTAAVTNGAFTSNVTGWTDSDESGATSAWLTGGYLSLIGTGTNAAIRDQQVTVNEANTEHALRVVIERGPVTLKVGSSSGGDEYVDETVLGTGTHSLAFTPTGNFHIRLQNSRIPASLVDSVALEASGTLELPVPWQEEDLSMIRHTQSGDILYVACDGYQQRKIERRGARSWSVVLYQPEDGPFRLQNTTPITLTPSAVSGDITLTASKAYFRSTNVGSLFRLASTGQLVTASLTGADQFTDAIRVSGIETQRRFQITITGTWTATVTLQYSVGEPGSWVDVKDWTANTSETHDDGLDNQIIYYRIGIKAGDYTSGTAVASLSFASGSITGIARVTGYTSATVVNAAVLKNLGGTTGTADWSEGAWSDRRGWPSAVALHEGRVWWPGKDKIRGSESDGYEDFDDETEGDAGPINRSIGEGPVDTIHWALSLNRLILGTASNSAPIAAIRIDGNSPISARSDSFDEPLSPTNFNLKFASTRGIFVDRSTTRLYELAFDLNTSDYKSEDLTLIVPDLNSVGIVDIAVQYKPDLRIHCWRTDGTAGVLVFDRAENVICWLEYETDGDVEDVCVLPGTAEDRVYYTVKRTINGATVRYREKWAMESECTGRPAAYHADSFYRYSGAATTTITGLGHLEGETVVVWGWNTATPFTDQSGNAIGRDLGTFTVSGGQIMGLSDAVTNACVGLAYTAQWKSQKQAFGAAMGTPLNQKKRIDKIGFVLMNAHGQGLRYGNSFDQMDALPLDDLPLDGEDPDTDHVFESYDLDMTEFDDDWSTDSRVCLEAAAPRPMTVLACSVSMQVNE
jgi:hypothetical protein